MADFTKGYEASTPESATAPNNQTDDAYWAPGSAATAVKKRWKGVPVAYPYGQNDEGGEGDA